MREGASLVGARPEILRAVELLHDLVRPFGIEFEVAEYGGLRSQADTTRILAFRAADFANAVKRGEIPAATDINKWRPIAPWGSSMHNYGAAFDVIVTKHPADMSGLKALNIIKDQAPKLGLVDGRAFGDGPHFELPGGLDAAKAAWKKQTGTKFFDNAVANQIATIATAPNTVAIVAFVVFALIAYFLVIRRR